MPKRIRKFSKLDLSKLSDYQTLQMVYKNADLVDAKAHQKIFEDQRTTEVMVRYKAIDKLLEKIVVQKDNRKHVSKKVTPLPWRVGVLCILNESVLNEIRKKFIF